MGLKIVGWYDTTSATEGSNASFRTAEVKLDKKRIMNTFSDVTNVDVAPLDR